ncbi:zinc finger MYND domain-containing protein 12 [Acanthochromis polyacanthus]|uniref:zinc finger MYND domain-containing protein 12 n=1 Tax=Acanthochromis polyacanthus TaxID=80966 RepID=UPI000B902A1A|nr:zinc finger MYND domain-containing protein 12 [Acanthochromis polyacanthus]XP_051805226.1 zinc finger MYND domain-containing protein 12 [Acanthochromis polyacanthus]XP_051805227.1 zinc finger MYND domain-containing protein 12 [Acanthochromis polyacanthus]
MEGKPKVSSKIIPLAAHKGAEKLCELCQRVARLQCTECRVTFYCDAEHQQADWVGIHRRICQLLVPIRTQRAGQIVAQRKKAELIEICRSVAQQKLSEGKHQEALPASQFCLRCSVDVHGPDTVQLVPAYLLLAEANIGLGNLIRVSELLSQAEWSVLKNPDCGHAVQHRLHRSLGRLHTATGNLEQALLHFANDIYFASEEFGLDSPITCRGYFLMADAFAKQGKTPVVRSLYSEVAQIWHCRLTNLLENRIQNGQNPNMLLDSSYDNQSDKAQQVEVDDMLRTMLEFEQEDFRKDPAQVARVAHCLAMMWFLAGDFRKALGFGSTALQAGQLIPNPDLTEPVQSLLQLVHSLQTESHPGSDESQNPASA